MILPGNELDSNAETEAAGGPYTIGVQDHLGLTLASIPEAAEKEQTKKAQVRWQLC